MEVCKVIEGNPQNGWSKYLCIDMPKEAFEQMKNNGKTDWVGGIQNNEQKGIVNGNIIEKSHL